VPFVVYSLQRLALFGVALVVLAWLRLGGWLLVVVAAVVAWAVSYLVLARSRDRAALWIAERVERRRTGPRYGPGLTADEEAEDAEADSLGARGTAGAPARSAHGSEGEAEPEQDAVAELEHPGAGEDGPQEDAARPEQHGARQERGGQYQQHHEE
jgi:hypothetical protein